MSERQGARGSERAQEGARGSGSRREAPPGRGADAAEERPGVLIDLNKENEAILASSSCPEILRGGMHHASAFLFSRNSPRCVRRPRREPDNSERRDAPREEGLPET